MKAFKRYHENQELYLKIKDHKAESLDELKGRIINFDNEEIGAELDLYHLILKHTRHCDLDDCAAHQQFLSIQRLVLSLVSPSYPLLLCRLDLVKCDRLDQDNYLFLFTYACQLWHDSRIYVRRKSMELVKRVIIYIENIDISPILQYLDTLNMSQMTDLDTILDPEYTEFFHTPMMLDRECLKLLGQIILDILLYHPLCFPKDFTSRLIQYDTETLFPFMFDLFCANDDDTIDLLYTILKIYKGGDTDLLNALDITPHRLFLYFLNQCGGTHDILIDFLLDKDMKFLTYFIHYVRYAAEHIDDLLQVLNELDAKDQFLTVMVKTMMVLQKGGFPYNTTPLVRRLNQLEELLL